MKKIIPFNVFMVLAILLITGAAVLAQSGATFYKDIYPNINLSVDEAGNYSTYQWHIKPGGDVRAVRFENKTAGSTAGEHWVYQKPLAFQRIHGKAAAVEIDLLPVGNQYGFLVKDYDNTRELVIRCDAERCSGDSLAAGSSKSVPAAGTTYYVRPDGGTSDQCTGTSDAPYPGSGANQPCAWSHPFWALDSSGAWKIQGGDTIIIGPGSYKMGYGAPNTSWCDADGAFDCDLPPLPSGPNSANPTRILGKGWDSGCTNAPELWGSQRPWQIIDLTGSSNVYIGCLEITDHSDCVEFHANTAVRCERDTYPFGDWASEGILASDSTNVTLKHLNIHGLASVGIRAGRISDWTVEDVRVAGNGWAGWDGDLSDENDSNTGTLTFKRFIVEWNGCGETYPGGQPHNCWAQTAGGYGDGFGTGATAGHWLFEDSVFRYNTSDGLDLLYARNSGSQIQIKRTMSYGNAGNPIKVNGPTAIENSLIIGNCGFFNGKSFTYNVDDCRAGGNALELGLRSGITVSVVNSTIAGQGDCLLSIQCDDSSCNGSETIILKNNIYQGYPDFLSPGDTTCYMWFDQFDYYNTQTDYNVVYGVKIADEIHLSAHDLNKNPQFVNSTLASFDGHLKSTSPAIDSGLAVGSLNGLIPGNDLEGNTRPSGTGVDRGAYEYQSTPTPTITVISPNGGESWQAGSSHAVTWSSTGTVGNVMIEYSTDNGGAWSTVTSSTANDGSYSWTVPDTPSTQCLVKISESDGSPFDASDAVFTISPGSGPGPEIELSRTQFFFGAYGAAAQTGPQAFLVNNGGSGTLNWFAAADQSWLSCTPGSGTGSGVITVSVDPAGLSSGTYTGTISVADANASNSPQTAEVSFTVYAVGGNSSPFGSFETPTDGSLVSSSIPVTGWALDDVQVTSVKIYLQQGSSLAYIGDAVFVEGARPDVEQANPGYPLNYQAGWGYMMLTNFLPDGGNGTYTFHAIAADAEGNLVTLGAKTITCDNANAVKPFGAIDTPAQGGIASGSGFLNQGWVLTPLPNTIPTDGSSINVYVDGVSLGHPGYNIYRADVAGLFPGYNNSGGAAGKFTLDTTSYENGVHSVFWTAADDAGNIDGIGSRFFSIQNSGQRQPALAGKKELKISSYDPAPVYIKKGWEKKSESLEIYPDDNGKITVDIKELERLVIDLAGTGRGVRQAGGAQWRGFQEIGSRSGPLPIGSYLDKERGIFYWQPGPGFLGEFRLIFVKEDTFKKRILLIKIFPKY